ncbi:MAG: 30S ribosomal protein S12 methylthiotransferase RimO [Clostridiales bacterium]|nr:30S ribosomal protein S12 methylthiotransferase RimO [Clostridiales bacterium]
MNYLRKIFFISLGCDKNLVDSEVMIGILERNGFEITYDEHCADAAIINTCGFIADAVKESIENIAETGLLKENGKLKALIVTGCLVSRYKEEILKEMPEVDAVVGAGDYDKIADVLSEIINGKKRIAQITQNSNIITGAVAENRTLTGAGYFAYLKIAEGCGNRCSYCTIWQIRGSYRSRDMKSLISEAEILAGKGVRELILVAQDTALYGTDLYGESRLHELIRRLSEIDGIKWIRVLYAYPEHITDNLIEEMAQNSKVCHYIDIPIQHADNNILSAMGRSSTAKNLELLITKLRQSMPDIALRTTLIAGFPGEGEEEFLNLKSFVERIRFDSLGVFEYSKEDGTKAAKMKNQVRKADKKKRRDLLMKTQKEISRGKLSQMVGQTLEVITDGKIEGSYCGRSYAQCYGIDGMIFFDADYEIISGEFVNVKITGCGDYDLYGELV